MYNKPVTCHTHLLVGFVLGLKFNKFLGNYLRDSSLIMLKKLSINRILADTVPESV